MLVGTPPPVAREFSIEPLKRKWESVHLLAHAHASPFDRQRPACAGPVMVGLDIDAGSCFSKLELLIQSHESHVDAAKCSKSVCPACHASAGFTRKDIRRRKLRYLRHNQVTSILHVDKIAIRLVRWKCSLCKYTFTDYPDFRNPV